MGMTQFHGQSVYSVLPRPRLALLAAAFALVSTGGGGLPMPSASAAGVPVDDQVLPFEPHVPASSPLPATATVAPPSARSRVTAAGSFHEGSEVEEIPLSALAAYQRTEVVMADAMRSCRLDWTLLAAVGHVLTDHGRRDGEHEIDDDGTVSPAIVGSVVRDTRGRRLDDSDGGELDGRRGHDRAVGPMLLAPAAWRDIGVDGDADGERDPQDIDDAALATAVLLCVDGENLQRPRQLKRALTGLSEAQEFLTTVPEVAEAYAADDTTFDAFPVFAGPAVQLVSTAPVEARPAAVQDEPAGGPQKPTGTSGGAKGDTSGAGKPKADQGDGGSKQDTTEPSKQDPKPVKTGQDKTGQDKGGQDKTPTPATPAEQPVDQPAEEPVDQPAEQPVDQPAEEPADQPAEQPAEEPAEEPADTTPPEEEPEPAPEPEPDLEPEAEESPAPKEETPAPVEKPECGADGAGPDAADEDSSCAEVTDAESTEPTGA